MWYNIATAECPLQKATLLVPRDRYRVVEKSPAAAPERQPAAAPDMSPSAAPEMQPAAAPDMSPSAAPLRAAAAAPERPPAAAVDILGMAGGMAGAGMRRPRPHEGKGCGEESPAIRQRLLDGSSRNCHLTQETPPSTRSVATASQAAVSSLEDITVKEMKEKGAQLTFITKDWLQQAMAKRGNGVPEFEGQKVKKIRLSQKKDKMEYGSDKVCVKFTDFFAAVARHGGFSKVNIPFDNVYLIFLFYSQKNAIHMYHCLLCMQVFSSGPVVDTSSDEYHRRCACAVDLNVLQVAECVSSADQNRYAALSGLSIPV
jgi:hypothetical protein